MALPFYSGEFNPKDIPLYFQNWQVSTKATYATNYRNGLRLVNKHSNGKWSTKLYVNDNAVYCIVGGVGGSENPADSKGWQYVPKTWSEFISDCLRYEDIDLLFTPKAVDIIFDGNYIDRMMLLKDLPMCPKGRIFCKDIYNDYRHEIGPREEISGQFMHYDFPAVFVKNSPEWFKPVL